MRIGIAWVKALLPVGVVLFAAVTAHAQYAQMPYAPQGGGPAQPAYYNQGGFQPGAEGAPEMALDPGMEYEYGPATDAQGIPYLGSDRAFGTGGIAHPRWFDLSADLLLFNRDAVSRTVNFSSAGAGGPIVLSTDNLNYPTSTGFRVTGNYLIGPGRSLEGSYFGTLNWAASQQAVGPGGTLFSPFSNFGADPGFLETDGADLHSLALSTNLNSTELNLRQRWTSPNARVHTSLLTGVRYVKVVEDLEYRTFAGPNNLRYLINTSNDLVGLQLGGDVLTAVLPRLKFGAEGKAGVYGNNAHLRNTINSTPGGLPDAVQETARTNNASFVGECGGFIILHVHPRVNIKAGYQAMVVTGLALAPENFSRDPNFAARPVLVNDGGHALYHGGQMGVEWVW